MSKSAKLIVVLLAGIWLLITLYPFIFMLQTSMKTNMEYLLVQSGHFQKILV